MIHHSRQIPGNLPLHNCQKLSTINDGVSLFLCACSSFKEVFFKLFYHKKYMSEKTILPLSLRLQLVKKMLEEGKKEGKNEGRNGGREEGSG